MWTKMHSNRNSHTLVAEIQNYIATWKKSLTVPYKVKYTLIIKSIIPLLGIYLNEIKKQKKHLYVNVCNSLSQPKTGNNPHVPQKVKG